MANEDLHELDELGNEENECEDEKSEEGMTGDFAGDVTIKKAHGEKGECNMEDERRREGEEEKEFEEAEKVNEVKEVRRRG